MISTKDITFKIFDKTFRGSTGMYNLTRFHEADKLQMVQDNRDVVTDYFKADHLLIMKQVHGTEVIDADLIQDFSIEPEGDASVTSKHGLILSVQSADCVPVLLASDNGKVIGAVHCGWRSAKADILIGVVSAMKLKGADNIFAIIGPAIHQKNYEVDQAFYGAILASGSELFELFKKTRNPQKLLFDLPGFVRAKLRKLGVLNIIDLCEDTYSNPDKYYSYRRDVHLGVGRSPTNILSVIMLNKA